MKKINVDIPNYEYDVYIEKGILDKLNNLIDTNLNYIIITDDLIPSMYIDKVVSLCNVLKVYKFKAGEDNKVMDSALSIIDSMILDNITKDTILITLGGGITGDIGGFIASVYLRGISYIQIPTTLLAMVDSSVGGKVGVNTKLMKNAIGSFKQPKLVIIDPNVLNTLSKRHINNGIAEIIKYALIRDKELFYDLLNNDIFNHIEEIIYKSILIKKDIVVKDVFDNNIRNLLNYGHTIGHALEIYSNHELLHGEAISIGMSLMSKEYPFNKELNALLNKYNLPTMYDYELDILLDIIKRDKKNKDGILNLVIVEDIASSFIKEINIRDIINYL